MTNSKSNIYSTAIMFTDIVGYSKMIEKDERSALNLLDEHNNIIEPIITMHDGEIIKLIGDSIFARFLSSNSSVFAAMKIQNKLKERNRITNKRENINIKIGLHFGEVFEKDEDLYGHDVNLGSRIENICMPGGISASESFCNQVTKQDNIWIRSMGFVKLKNISKPQNLFRIYLDKEEYLSETDDELKKNQINRGVNIVDLNTYQEKEIKSIGILNLNNIGEKKDAFMAYSITENLINDLKKIPSIRAPGINDVQKYANSELPISELARRLNVDYIVSGLILKTDNQIKISLNMIDTKTGETAWSENWEGSVKYTGTLNGKIISGILNYFEIDVPEHINQYFTYEMTENREAYELFLKGKNIVDLLKGPKSLIEAEKYFEKAVSLDNDFVEAHAYQAMVYRWMYRYEEAEEKLEEALRISKINNNEPGLATVYNYFGILLRACRKYEKAIENFKKALELQSQICDRFSEGKILHNMAGCYSAMQKTDKGEKLIKTALEIFKEYEEDHFIANALAEIGNMHKNNGQYSESITFHFESISKFHLINMEFNEFRLKTILANTFLDIGIYDIAKQYANEALPIVEEYGDYTMVGRNYYILGFVDFVNDDVNNGIDNLHEAIENFQIAEENARIILVLCDLILFCLTANKFKLARRSLSKGFRIAKKLKDDGLILRLDISNQLLNIIDISDNIDLLELKTIESTIHDHDEDSFDYLNWWLLATCYGLLNDKNISSKYLNKAKKSINISSSIITDLKQRDSFFNKHVFNRKIINDQLLT